MIKIVQPDFSFSDDRGSLVQLVREGYRQVNVVRSTKGALRGGHYHLENRELFYVVSGAFELRAEQDGNRETRAFCAGDMFLVEPGVTHSFYYLEDTVLVALYDKGVETPQGKDIISAK